MTTWQPIETAPKDGRRILLGWHDGQMERYVVARWAGGGWYEGKVGDVALYVTKAPVTYWAEIEPITADGEGVAK